MNRRRRSLSHGPVEGGGATGGKEELRPHVGPLPLVQGDAARTAAERGPRRKLSVILAVQDAAEVLGTSLSALQRSTLARDQWELIVVDDGSRDESASIAAEFADVLIRLPGKPRGPAYARNRGCEASEGEVLVFLDPDVSVHPDVLERFARLFDSNPSVGAAFGSYDTTPHARGVVSRFRSLLHHYIHQSNPGEAQTFWAGCGAIRRSALRDVEMFNEWHYSRRQVEDIEIGRRLRRKGHQILLCPEIQATHLKRWTLREMLATDFASRGVPWARVLLQEASWKDFEVLDLSRSERISAAAAAVGTAGLLAAILLRSSVIAAGSLLIFAVILILHGSLIRLFYQRGGVVLAVAALPLLLMYYVTAVFAAAVGYLAHVVLGEPQAEPEIEAEAAMDLQIWPPSPRSPADHPWARPPHSPAPEPALTDSQEVLPHP